MGQQRPLPQQNVKFLFKKIFFKFIFIELLFQPHHWQQPQQSFSAGSQPSAGVINIIKISC